MGIWAVRVVGLYGMLVAEVVILWTYGSRLYRRSCRRWKGG